MEFKMIIFLLYLSGFCLNSNLKYSNFGEIEKNKTFDLSHGSHSDKHHYSAGKDSYLIGNKLKGFSTLNTSQKALKQQENKFKFLVFTLSSFSALMIAFCLIFINVLKEDKKSKI